MKKIVFLAMAFLLFASVPRVYAYPIIERIFLQRSSPGDIYLRYKGAKYLLRQYRSSALVGYYSLQPSGNDGEKTLAPAMLYINWGDGAVKEFVGNNADNAPEFTVQDINGDGRDDLILFWQSKEHLTRVEVWLKNMNDFTNVFAKSTINGADFRVMNGVPTLAFKKELLTDGGGLDTNYDYYMWDGKTFSENSGEQRPALETRN